MRSYREYPGWKKMEPVCNLLYHIVNDPHNIKSNKWYVFQEENLDSDFDDYVEFIEFDFVEDAEEYFIFKLHQFAMDGFKQSFEELRFAKGEEINIYLGHKSEYAWLDK